MERLSYLAVYVSLILAIAVSRNLIGLAYLIEQRDRVKWSWPFVAWGVGFVVVGALEWWNLLEWRTFEAIYVWDFLLMLLAPVLFFMMCALLFPSFRRSGEIDLWAQLDRVRPWFFSIGAAYTLRYLLVWSVIVHKSGVSLVDEAAGDLAWVAATLVASVLLAVGAFVRSRRYHEFLVLAMGLLMVVMFL
jgi:hypothetical protein